MSGWTKERDFGDSVTCDTQPAPPTIMVLSSLTTARKRALSDGPDVQSLRKKIKDVNDTSHNTATAKMEIDSKTQNMSVSESCSYNPR